MSFFDFFKKKPELAQNKTPPEMEEAGIPPAQPLDFQPVGDFQIASCPGQYALDHLEKLQREGRDAGFSVILLGGKKDAEQLAENRKYNNTFTEEYLRLAAAIDVDEWLKKRVEVDPEYYSQSSDGDWPSATPEPGRIIAHTDILTEKPKPLAFLAKLPTGRNWEAPAYIGMGGWNECPDAAALTAFAKRWQERYGAEVVSITHDIMEFQVAKPPTTKEAALELAKEQYIFCADIVDQGVGSVPALAATLLNSRYWYFWWD